MLSWFKRFYNFFGLSLTILIGLMMSIAAVFILSLFLVQIYNLIFNNESSRLASVIIQLIIVSAIIVSLFYVVKGVSKIVFLKLWKEKIKKNTGAKKDLLRGIIAFVIVFLFYYFIAVIANLYGVDGTVRGLPEISSRDLDNPVTGFPIKDLQIVSMRPVRQSSVGRYYWFCNMSIKNNNSSLTATNLSLELKGKDNAVLLDAESNGGIHIPPGQIYEREYAFYEFEEFQESDSSTACNFIVNIKDAGIVGK